MLGLKKFERMVFNSALMLFHCDLNRELAVAKGVCEAGAELCFDKDNHTSGVVRICVEGNVLIICDSDLFGVFSFCKNKDIWGSIRE